jgi:hypothetical protein
MHSVGEIQFLLMFKVTGTYNYYCALRGLRKRNVDASTILSAVTFVMARHLPATLREEHRLRVFENRMLRGIFGPERDGKVGGCRKQQNKESRIIYSSTYIIRMIRWRMR